RREIMSVLVSPSLGRRPDLHPSNENRVAGDPAKPEGQSDRNKNACLCCAPLRYAHAFGREEGRLYETHTCHYRIRAVPGDRSRHCCRTRALLDLALAL